ncbi:MAG: DUF2950 family protein [Bryobacterales bacterium]|nr:DUF2950 family protein [Bryobacterales bacterium]
MTAKTFTMIFVVATSTLFAQTPSAPPKAAHKKAQMTFESPQAAAQALIDAASKNETATLTSILGTTAKGILTSGDAKQDEAERHEFAQIATAKHHLERSSMNSRVMVLLIGDQDWPFPVPLLHEGERWRFDSERGAVEVQARKIGADELDAIEACAGYVNAQQAYSARKRSAAGTQEYAQNVATSPVSKEIADAAGDKPTRPYHGYYFRALKSQGPHAPGGEHPYMVGKAVIGGFALVAWPATYGVTGIHTFLVNQDGVVYEKDRGAHPATPVTSYDPDSSWTPVD